MPQCFAICFTANGASSRNIAGCIRPDMITKDVTLGLTVFAKSRFPTIPFSPFMLRRRSLSPMAFFTGSRFFASGLNPRMLTALRYGSFRLRRLRRFSGYRVVTGNQNQAHSQCQQQEQKFFHVFPPKKIKVRLPKQAHKNANPDSRQTNHLQNRYYHLISKAGICILSNSIFAHDKKRYTFPVEKSYLLCIIRLVWLLKYNTKPCFCQHFPRNNQKSSRKYCFFIRNML